MAESSGGVAGLKFLKALVWIVYAIATAACIILAFGFVLLMFGANTSAGFAEFIYSWSLRFAGPFVGMIEPTKLANGGVLSWSALVAVVAYAVLAALIGGVVNAISRSIYRKTRPAPAPAVVVAAQPAPQPAPPAAAPQPAPAAAPAPAPAARRRLAEPAHRHPRPRAGVRQPAPEPARAEEPASAEEPPAS